MAMITGNAQTVTRYIASLLTAFGSLSENMAFLQKGEKAGAERPKTSD
jgi:hypothetical protein